MSKINNISLVSLGCSKNLVDSEILIGKIKSQKINLVDNPSEADTLIVNTCGFLDSAREESIDTILELSKYKENGTAKKLVVMGCFSERFSNELSKELPEVDRFYGTNDQDKIISYLTGNDYAIQDPDYQRFLLTPKHYAYLKIAEGCDNGCSFCSIPLMRGLQKSQPLEWNIEEAKRLASRGIKELLVIAQDSTSYGWDLDRKSNLAELLTRLNTIKDLEWIRLHYAHPAHLHTSMIELFSKLDKLAPYIDMPIQHGSDKMLKLMRRGLKSDGIKKRIDLLRKSNPSISIRTSIIVGFPGETEDDFLKLCKFIEEIEFDRLGVFTYSNEPGTYAFETMKDEIPNKVKTQRLDEIMKIQQKISLKKNKQLVDSIQNVIIDFSFDEGYSIGRTYRDAPEIDNYVKINRKLKVGEFYKIKIIEAYEYDLSGELI